MKRFEQSIAQTYNNPKPTCLGNVVGIEAEAIKKDCHVTVAYTQGGGWEVTKINDHPFHLEDSPTGDQTLEAALQANDCQ